MRHLPGYTEDELVAELLRRTPEGLGLSIYPDLPNSRFVVNYQVGDTCLSGSGPTIHQAVVNLKADYVEHQERAKQLCADLNTDLPF